MIDLNFLAGWMMSVLVSLSPLNMKTYQAADTETVVEKKERLESMAHDIVEVVFDDAETPLFHGTNGRLKSAVFVATWASHESGAFRKGVELGSNRGDRGTSWCIMQLHIGNKKTVEGWTGKELIEDRKKCIRAGYHAMQRSLAACHGVPERDAMAAYASGKCDAGVGLAQRRYDQSLRLYTKYSFEKYSKDNGNKDQQQDKKADVVKK
jgi:hypothetical protein